ncbi:MAG: DUF3780 domain-containing protein [Leptospiraceae bacterium]|nr:DUF3780 domain-containing protein [Leptospiraceae bacterium]MCP5501884.1 DUF3780 domain-containing protein [Leptospiraceae bacterium]
MKQEASALSFLKFGARIEEITHHFAINLGNRRGPFVYISEHFEVFENEERRKLEYTLKPEDPKMKVVLPYDKWKEIEEPVCFTLNQSLKRAGLKKSRFKAGINALPRLLGKEVILLCWAIEEVELDLIPIAIRNWQGLQPEERWWLFTMTNAASGQAVKDRSRGWRKAVRYALTENPVSE